ncbi:variant erythrocyte surface antigen-1 family protein [Babesia caballi]|uniref:Variant erythrocyte surface antigen-1 family protein n=1 Tax=Babesia caballi TaxID=5871 RepID=A0AAV4LYR3_BABCB|nr:variant erythrocyte surface antigen-1 family protein [Babesia caballi]
MSPGQKMSLTQPPKDLKEAVDFIAAVGGGFGTRSLRDYNYKNVSAALKNLKGFNGAADETLRLAEYDSIIKELAQGLGFKFLGYEGQNDNTFSGTGIIGASKGYISTYAGIDWPSNGDQQTCALIFLGCAVVAYYCLSYFYWRCSESHGKGDWRDQSVGGGGIYLNEFLNAMGYNDGVLNNAGYGGVIMDNVASDLDELKATVASRNDYSVFLQNLDGQISSRKPINCPLASCFKIASSYFESHKSAEAKQITGAITAIRSKLVSCSQKPESYAVSLESNPYDDSKQSIQNLLTQLKAFDPSKEGEKLGQGVHPAAGKVGKGAENSISAQPSNAGPVAATLTTLSLGGGAAAAYILNLGGAKTVVNGLLKIG